MDADGARARIGGTSIEDTRANVMRGTTVMTMIMAGATTTTSSLC